MYHLKEGISPEKLRPFGFKTGREYPDNERCICNDYQRDNYWLIPMDPDEPDKIHYADPEFNQPIWSIEVGDSGRIWIECVPSGTYHIGSYELEPMLHVLRMLILEGFIDDDFEPNTESAPEMQDRHICGRCRHYDRTRGNRGWGESCRDCFWYPCAPDDELLHIKFEPAKE